MLTMLVSMLIAGSVYAGNAININTATVEQLQTVKGIGEKIAMAIVHYRQVHGDFLNVSGLVAVKGVGDKKLAKIEAYVMVEPAK